MICAYEPCPNQQGPGPLCPSCEGKVYRDLTQIADHWADLEQALPTGGGGGEKVSGTKTIGLPFNQQVAAVRHEISHGISYYAQVIVTATQTLVPPDLVDTAAVAKWIAKNHLHLTRHHDTNEATGIRRDAQDFVHLAQNALDADSRHNVPIGKCFQPQCEGWIYAPYRERQPLMPDLKCNTNPDHTWQPSEYPYVRRMIKTKGKQTA